MLPKFLIAVAFLVACSAPQTQAQDLFFRPPTAPIDGQTVSADFNGDGKPDIVTLSGDVLLGNGDGTFTPATPWSVGPHIAATAIATGDFNGDGKPDLVVSVSPNQIGPVSAFLYVLLGNGDGTFQPAIAANPAGAVLTQIVVADVNGDGKADVVGIGPVLVILLGNGDGRVGSLHTYPTPTNCFSVITVADFNGDRKPDIAIASPGFSGGSCATGLGSVGVFLGNGDGTFQSAVISTGVNGPDGLVVGDFDGDGKLDLVISDVGTSQTFTLLGNGDGTFQAPSSPISGFGTVGVADLNGDGKLDIVVWGPLFVGVFFGNGNGTFTTNDTYLANRYGQPGGIVLADFNGEGITDMAASETVFFGNVDGSFQGNSAILLNVPPLNGPSLGTIATGDFNHDGIPDLAVAADSTNSSASHNLYILLGDGTGRFFLAHTYALPASAYSLQATDINGDGKLDLLFTALDSTSNFSWAFDVMLGNGDGTFAAPVTSPIGIANQLTSVPLAVADLNGDHLPDIAAITAGQVSIFSGNGDGTFGSPVNYFAGASPISLLAADFNNDGKVDLAVGSSAGIGTLLGNGDGTFQSPVFFSGNSSVLAVADINGDGNVDIVANPELVLLGNGDGTFTPLPNANPLATVGSFVSLVDVNGDGKLDLVDSLGVRVFLGNGDGTFGPPISFMDPTSNGSVISGSAQGGTLFAIADFSRDGRPDIAVVLSVDAQGVVTFLNTAPAPNPDFLTSVSPLVPATIAPGSTATTGVTLTPVGGFNAAVTLSCSGLPSGAACSFAPSSLPNGSGTSALTISTSASVPVGTYPVGIVSASTNLSHTRALSLTVATAKGAASVGLAPTTLTFAQQLSGTASSAQSTTLANTGSAPLAISGVSITGANAGDFAQTNTCGSSLGVGSNCQIRVTFTPTGLGTRSAAISISDNATGSPHMVGLTGTGQDFSLGSGATASASVTPGQTATYTLSLSSGGGFNQSVTLTCSGAPAGAACSVSPAMVSLSGTTAATATVTVTTTAASQMLPVGTNTPGGMNDRLPSLLLCLLAMLAIASLYISRRDHRFRLAPAVTLALLLCLGMMLTSCGGSGSSGGGSTGTQPGTYTITVSGSATSGSTTLTHATKLTLVVQ